MTVSNTSAGGLHRSAHGNNRESRLACAGVRDRWDCADVQRAGTGAEAGVGMTAADHIIVWRRQEWEQRT